MDVVLDKLDSAAKEALFNLRSEHIGAIDEFLHNHGEDQLPNQRITAKANALCDTLREIQLLLQPAPLILADHFLGYTSAKCLLAAVKLGIADILGQTRALTLCELAKTCNANPIRLEQIIRMLSNEGVFTYDKPSNTVSNNHVSKLLMRSHWMGWSNWVDLYTDEFYDMAKGIPQACQADETRSPGQICYNTELDISIYFKNQGWLPKFYKTLNAAAVAQRPGLLTDYPWQEIEEQKIIDVGGGDGGFIGTLLRAFPNMQGGVFEKPEVIDLARTNFRNQGAFSDVGSRVRDEDLVGGDFFRTVPANDIYLMKWCLHNWLDEDAVKILKCIRNSITRSDKSRLVLFECLLETGYSSRLARYADMNMFIAVNGRERSLEQWKIVSQDAGWSVSRTFHPRNAWPAAIELVPLWSATEPESNKQHLVSGDIFSSMTFLIPWDESKGKPYFRSTPDEGLDQTNIRWEDHDVTVFDARQSKSRFSLDLNGFQYVDDDYGPLSERLAHALGSNEKGIVVAEYYPRIQELVKKHTGAKRVIIFDHTVRRRRPQLDARSNENGQEQPATIVHCDQSREGAINRLKQNLQSGEHLEDILKNRVQLINVWRPLNGAVIDWPLAQMDFSSLAPSNVYPCDLLRHKDEWRGQTVAFTYSPTQKWYYLSGHRTDEVTLLKIWDSSSEGIANICAHTAFKHPDTPKDVEPRESIEVRCIIIY